MEKGADKSPSQSQAYKAYLFVMEKRIGHIKDIFHDTKSQSHQHTEKNQIPSVCRCLFHKQIITRRKLKIFFSISGDQIVQYHTRYPKKVSAIADRDKAHSSSQDHFYDFFISSFQKRGEQQQKCYAVEDK